MRNKKVALLTVVFLYFIPRYIEAHPQTVIKDYYDEDFQVGYILLANVIGSVFMVLFVIKDYFKLKWRFDRALNAQMLRYSFPVFLASLAFAINEHFDKVLLEWLLPEDIAKSEVGKYSACYKIGVFMILFRMAYTLGIEPFFFNYAKNEDAKIKYATITKYFTLFGSLAMLIIVVLSDVVKLLLIPNKLYWEAMVIVPFVILANLLLGIYTNLSVWYKLQDKTIIGAYISIFGALVTIVLNLVLVPVIGIIGSALTTLVAYLLMMIISYVLGQRYYPIPYDKAGIGLYLIIASVFSFVYFYFFRENYWVGGTLIILYLLLIIYRELPLKIKG